MPRIAPSIDRLALDVAAGVVLGDGAVGVPERDEGLLLADAGVPGVVAAWRPSEKPDRNSAAPARRPTTSDRERQDRGEPARAGAARERGVRRSIVVGFRPDGAESTAGAGADGVSDRRVGRNSGVAREHGYLGEWQ